MPAPSPSCCWSRWSTALARSCSSAGALHAALEPHRPAIAATIVYVVVTAATGNVALVIAAVVMGALFSLERLSTRGVLAPMLTHLTWSTLMVLALPR